MERFATVNREFYRGADMCVLVYAVDEAASFEKLNFWYDAFVDATGVSPGSGFPFVVLGNKVDLDGAAHVVLEADVAAWCQARGGMPHFLVCAVRLVCDSSADPPLLRPLFSTVGERADRRERRRGLRPRCEGRDRAAGEGGRGRRAYRCCSRHAPAGREGGRRGGRRSSWKRRCVRMLGA